MRLFSLVAVAALSMAATCFAQSSPALCPRHIEAPVYPAVARTADVTGKVPLRVTSDENGKVIKAELAPGTKPNQVLDDAAIENVRHWTFAKPPAAPYVETMVYDNEFDDSLPMGGQDVTFDLPDHVTLQVNFSTSITP